MALKEITDLAEITSVSDLAWLHTKLGGTDYRIRPQVLFDLYNSRTTGNEANRSVTKAEVGLGNVSNDLQLKQASNLTDVPDKSAARTALSVDSSTQVTAKVAAHSGVVTGNPHGVTKTDVGLGSVLNYGVSSTITDTSNTKYATIGAVAQVNTRVTGLELNVIPSGGVIMWPSLNPIPAGWRVLDGSNGTIDMRGKFPRGGDALPGDTQVGTVGGSDTFVHTHPAIAEGTALSIEQTPAHRHHSGHQVAAKVLRGGTGSNASQPDLTNASPTYLTGLTGGGVGAVEGEADEHGHPVTVNSNAATPQSNLPPYYTMIFIQKI